MIICDLLTGFLGSGKTTLLNSFLRTPAGADTAVIVNEFGAIGLDQLLYKEVSTDVYLLESGCLCCTVVHSLRETLLAIRDLTARMGRPQLRGMVIETTGLADPSPILHSLLGDRALADFKLGQVITTVDAVQGEAQLKKYAESFRQVSMADHIVITKTDLVDDPTLRALRLKMIEINAFAQVTESVAGSSAVEVFDYNSPSRGQQLLRRPRDDCVWRESGNSDSATFVNSAATFAHNNEIGSWSSFVDVRPVWAGVSAWWNLLVHQYRGRLLRCKGLLNMNEMHPFVLIQGVGEVFHSPTILSQWPDADVRGRIVCIGLRLDPGWLQNSLQALSITEPSSQPLTLDELRDCL